MCAKKLRTLFVCVLFVGMLAGYKVTAIEFANGHLIYRYGDLHVTEQPEESANEKRNTKTAAELFKLHKVTLNPNKLVMKEQRIGKDAICGVEGYYFLDIENYGEYEDEPAKITLSVQTLTKANLNRIADAIRENYREKGLPKCLLQDAFNMEYYLIRYEEEFKNVVY